MPRFFFHLNYLLDRVTDPEGSDCLDLDTARIEAKAIIRELAADCLAQDRLFEPISISIESAAGKLLAKVSVAEAINEILPLVRMTPPTPNCD